MQITFDPREVSAEERTWILTALGVGSETAPAEEAPPAAAPARRTRRAAPKPPEPVEEDEDEPEEDEEEDLLGGDDEDEAPAEITKDDVIALATSLVQKGKSSDVKAALEEVGVAKVSLIKTKAQITKMHGLLKKIK